jgi:hypothetical protein
MSVSAITQSHAAATEHTQAPASQKAQSGRSKANTAQATASASPSPRGATNSSGSRRTESCRPGTGRAEEWWSGRARQFVRVGFARTFGALVRRSNTRIPNDFRRMFDGRSAFARLPPGERS